jgi:hypothetical protein
LGGPKERTIPLDDLLGVTILLSDTPPMSFASVVRTLATAYDMAKSGATSPEPWVATLPKGLFVRLDERSDGDHVRQTELAFALDGIDDERGMVAIAYRIADAAGLGYSGVFALPGVGVEVRLSRLPGPRLEALGELGDEAARKKAAATALAAAGVPPFEPARFKSAYRVEAWEPGRRVVFRRPFSKWAFAIFPFTLLVLVGPGILLAGYLTGRELNLVNTLILSVVAAAFGIPCVALFLGMLPRSVVFDWSTDTLSIRRWPRLKTFPLRWILGIEARAHFSESGGEGGGSTRSHTCELKARIQLDSDAGVKNVDLLVTDQLLDADRPKREAFPLAVELAKSLGVAHRIEDYSYRTTKR